MEEELLATIRGNDNEIYEIYSNKKVYRVKDGKREECTDFVRKNIKKIYGEEKVDVEDDGSYRNNHTEKKVGLPPLAKNDDDGRI